MSRPRRTIRVKTLTKEDAKKNNSVVIQDLEDEECSFKEAQEDTEVRTGNSLKMVVAGQTATMNLVSWICQGMGQALTKPMLIELSHLDRPSLVFSIETKGKKNKVDRIRRGLGFNNSFYIDPEGNAGGLALWRTNELEVEIRDSNKNFIDVWTVFGREGKEWCFTFVYGAPKQGDRKEVLDSILKFH